MKINCLVVDDEPLSQDVLKRYIEDCPSLALNGVASDAFMASNMLLENDIQLLFLDINMPKLSGIRFAKTLNNPPLIIFTTAYPEFAVDGFEVDAIDYLVKPFPFERFLKAVNKAVEKIKSLQQKDYPTNDYILLKSDKKVYKVDFDEINYLQSYGDYIKVFLCDKCLVVHDTFKNMIEQLPSDRFIRIHKSYLIAIGKIQYIEGNQVKIGNEVLPVGLNFKDDLLRMLKEK